MVRAKQTLRVALALATAACGSAPIAPPPLDAAVDAPVFDAGPDAPPDPGRVVISNDPTCYPAGITVDDVYVYYTCSATFTVNRAPKLGGPSEVLAKDRTLAPHRIVVSGGTLAWVEAGTPPNYLDGAIVTMPKDASSAPTVVASSLRRAVDVALAGQDVFYIESGTFIGTYSMDGEVHRVSAGADATLAANLDYPVRLAVDDHNVYFTINYGGSVASCARAGCGGAPSIMLAMLDQPTGVAFFAGWLYVAESHGGRVLTLPAIGGSPQTLEASRGIPAEIVVSGDQMLWTETLTREVNRAATAGGPFETLDVSPQEPDAIAIDDKAAYYVDEKLGTVVRVPR